MTISESIKLLAMSGKESYCKICEVTAINTNARTIDCVPIDGDAPLLGVSLQANQGSDHGIVVYPSQGSYVVVSFIGDAVAIVTATDKIDKVAIKVGDIAIEVTDKGVIYNGGNLGGLINIQDLTNKINALIDAFNTHTHSIPAGGVAVTGSATAQSNPISVIIPAIAFAHNKLDISDYEDIKIKH